MPSVPHTGTNAVPPGWFGMKLVRSYTVPFSAVQQFPAVLWGAISASVIGVDGAAHASVPLMSSANTASTSMTVVDGFFLPSLVVLSGDMCTSCLMACLPVLSASGAVVRSSCSPLCLLLLFFSGRFIN